MDIVFYEFYAIGFLILVRNVEKWKRLHKNVNSFFYCISLVITKIYGNFLTIVINAPDLLVAPYTENWQRLHFEL